mmetsp:Transcript_10938/g.16469  ORF Transcript_10938/g.16469 Transcript_10938/m.16469 type:complete len:567 (-) Transcript_10938:32-1732(-)
MASLPILGGIALLIGLIILALKFAQKSSSTSTTTSSSSTLTKKANSSTNKPLNRKVTLNPEADAKYILNTLTPKSTPLEILYAIATSPDNITVATKSLELRADVVQRKLAHLVEQAKKAEDAQANATLDELLNDDDDDAWANDDEDDEAAQLAKAAKEEKKKQAAALAKATGKDAQDVTKVMLEGVDDNVLGMQWVKKNLTALGVWPPPKYATKNNINMDAPTERNLIMTMGRLNARALNSHPDLLQAGPTGKIDPTYFQSTMEYRQRVGQQLDNVLRFACTLRSFQLACAVLDAIVMFKIGCMDAHSEVELKWFQNFMEEKYGKEGTPKLILEDTYLGVPTEEPSKDKEENKTEAEKKEEEKNKLVQLIAQSRQVTTTDDKMSLEMQITRQHAEAFTKEKLALCQRQGIPPQIGMQAYRESWFIIVRAYKLNEDGSRMSNWDGAMGGSNPNHFEVLKGNKHAIFDMLTEDTIASFEKEFVGSDVSDRKVIVGWPFVISNVAQKSGKVKIHLPPPDVPGKYEFSVTIKSQEFLCGVEEFKLVVDIAQGVKKKKDEGEEDKESKKDK